VSQICLQLSQLNNSLIQYILDIVNNGLDNVLMGNSGLSKGVCTYKGFCTNEILANTFEVNYKPLRVFSTN